MTCAGRIKILGINGEVVEEIPYEEEIGDVEQLKNILGPRIRVLKGLRGKINVVLKKPNGEPLKTSDFPYCGELIVEVTTSGAEKR